MQRPKLNPNYELGRQCAEVAINAPALSSGADLAAFAMGFLNYLSAHAPQDIDAPLVRSGMNGEVATATFLRIIANQADYTADRFIGLAAAQTPIRQAPSRSIPFARPANDNPKGGDHAAV